MFVDIFPCKLVFLIVMQNGSLLLLLGKQARLLNHSQVASKLSLSSPNILVDISER